MFVTEAELRNTISKLLTEGQRTDAIAGEMAQCIVTSVAAYCTRIFMRSTPQKRKSPPANFELKFDFSKSSVENMAINKSYDASFLMNPKTPADRNRRSAYLSNPNIGGLINRMLTLHKKHNGVKSRLDSALASFKKRRDATDQVISSRMHEEIALQFSGKVTVVVSLDRQKSNRSFIMSGESFSGGAHIDQTKGDMQVEMLIPRDFMDFFSNTSKSQIQDLYKAFEIAKGNVKGVISHELTHTTQKSGFDTRRESYQSSRNRIADYVDRNVAHYSPIDPVASPLIVQLYNRLGTALKIRFSSNNFLDFMMLQEGNHGDRDAQTDFQYFGVLIKHFAPEEIDAYVRGHRTDAIASDKQALRYTKSKRPQRLRFQFQDIIRDRLDSFLPPSLSMLNSRIAHHLSVLGIGYQALRKEAEDTFMNKYDEIYGKILPKQKSTPKQKPTDPLRDYINNNQMVQNQQGMAKFLFDTLDGKTPGVVDPRAYVRNMLASLGLTDVPI